MDRVGARARAAREPKEGRMLQSSENSFNQKSGSPASNPNAYNPVKTVTAPVDQATIGRTLVIKGEISGSEALYIDGRIEGKITMPESRVTIGRNGKVDASIQAREVVIMGKVNWQHRVQRPRRYPRRRLGQRRHLHRAHQRGRRRRAQGRNSGPQRRQAEPAARAEASRGSQGPGGHRQRVIGGTDSLGTKRGTLARAPLFLFDFKAVQRFGSNDQCT